MLFLSRVYRAYTIYRFQKRVVVIYGIGYRKGKQHDVQHSCRQNRAAGFPGLPEEAHRIQAGFRSLRGTGSHKPLAVAGHPVTKHHHHLRIPSSQEQHIRLVPRAQPARAYMLDMKLRTARRRPSVPTVFRLGNSKQSDSRLYNYPKP